MKGIIWVDDFIQSDDLGNISLSYGVQHLYRDFFFFFKWSLNNIKCGILIMC